MVFFESSNPIGGVTDYEPCLFESSNPIEGMADYEAVYI